MIIRPRREKTCLNIKGADQPAHPHSLIIASVIRILESIVSGLAMSKISIFKLVFVAEETGLNLALSYSPKTSFVEAKVWIPV